MVGTPDSPLLVEVAQNVKYLRTSFDEHKNEFFKHVEKDEKITAEYLKPLYEEWQQRKGAEKARGMWGAMGGYLINAGIAVIAAWAAVKGIAK